MPTDTTLFDLAVGIEEPRARTTDPGTSHAAADKSQAGLSKLRMAVLRAVATFQIPPVGSEINDRYALWTKTDHYRFPAAHPDSPRKRAGELADLGYLDVIGKRVGAYGSEESIYRVSPEGRRLLEVTK